MLFFYGAGLYFSTSKYQTTLLQKPPYNYAILRKAISAFIMLRWCSR